MLATSKKASRRYRYSYGDDRPLPRPLLAGSRRLERYLALFNFLCKPLANSPPLFTGTCVPTTRYDSRPAAYYAVGPIFFSLPLSFPSAASVSDLVYRTSETA